MKETIHSFNTEDAKKYGVECAVLLYNIHFWLDKNKANNKNIYDGRVWVYNSIKAFSILFPYMKEKQIYNRLKKLEDEGVLLSGNFNQNKYDRTRWYSINDEEYALTEYDNSIPKNEIFHSPKMENGFSKEGEPIPDINTDSKPDNKPSKSNVKPNDLTDATELANDFIDAICDFDSSHRYTVNRPPVSVFSSDIERAIRIDGRTKEQIKWMIDYLFRSKRDSINSFWAPNIQSIKKLRLQFDTIKNQIIREQKNKGNGRTFDNAEQKIRETERFLDQYYSKSE